MSDNQLQLFDSPKEAVPVKGLICPSCQAQLVEDWSLTHPGVWKGAHCYDCGWDRKPAYLTEVNS